MNRHILVGKKRIWQLLRNDNLYSKDLKDFRVQFNNEESRRKLFRALVSDGYYTKNYDEFKEQFLSKKHFRKRC